VANEHTPTSKSTQQQINNGTQCMGVYDFYTLSS
jgi:hypothetical protein